ncbi:adenosylmethionine decarboxylase [Cognatishimia sp. F0-27]|uniref:adenosylmethionine decarboxylase n=1 Tax=Cognatishimia sp. F0-27 TaxID=2816855 RepID=UPI001D0C2668|nr:adenosylmethionine decarboxylase [Cognatishimia sp. F0-27]MCC1493617.1 adenosylmethionine decarboxylase [Cognatishimia sp. F0-27]
MKDLGAVARSGKPQRTGAPSTATDGTASRAVRATDRVDHFAQDGTTLFAGTHLIIEVVGGKGLDREDRIRAAFQDCIAACGATLVHMHVHRFSPHGLSGVAVLAESHITVHTWPEIGYGAFDVFMCGDADPWQTVGVLARAFETDDVRVRALRRGEDVLPARS